MEKAAIIRLGIKIVGTFVILITAGIWFFFSSNNKGAYITMNKDIQFEELYRKMGDTLEYRATSSINISNVPDNSGYQVKIQVKLYGDEELKRELNEDIQYELEDDVLVENGTQPVSVKLKIKDSSFQQETIHVVMSAELEKS